MGYNLVIGEARVVGGKGEFLRVDAVPLESEEAPIFVGDSQYNSQRSVQWPSYSQWAEFAREARLYPFFYSKGIDAEGPDSGEEGLLSQHPGAMFITEEHVQVIREAYQFRKKLYPDRIEGWAPKNQENPAYDPTLARLHWLLFWFEYAIKHCKIPTFTNS